MAFKDPSSLAKGDDTLLFSFDVEETCVYVANIISDRQPHGIRQTNPFGQEPSSFIAKFEYFST